MSLDKRFTPLGDLPRLVVVRADAGRLGADEEAHDLGEVGRVVSVDDHPSK
jgi:hypothetical protein